MCVCLRTRERAAAPGAQGFAQPPPRLSELAGGRLIIYRVSPKRVIYREGQSEAALSRRGQSPKQPLSTRWSV